MASGSASADGGSGIAEAHEKSFSQLLFQQELNEIYLLLDFISGRPDKDLNALNDKIKDPDGLKDSNLTAGEVIQRISILRYPPEGTIEQKSKDAAFLLQVKDALNSIAYPARGLTIAYTTLFTDPGRSTGARRPALAGRAYPTLVNHAKWFRRINIVLASVGLVTMILAAVLLWLITYGVQLTARFEEAKRNDTASAARVFDQLNSLKAGGADLSSYEIVEVCKLNKAKSGDHRQGLALSQSGAADEPKRSQDSGARRSSIPAMDTSAVQQACADYAFKHAQLCVTVADFGAYADSAIFKAMGTLLPVHRSSLAEECDIYPDNGGDRKAGALGASVSNSRLDSMIRFSAATNDTTAPRAKPEAPALTDPPASRRGRQEDAISIAGVLSVTSNYLLPMVFGLCGSIVAVIRSVQNKINDSLLVPRDRALAMIRLPLGMIAGVTVGLFLSPDGAAKSTSGLGGFTLSASGIAFLAGYGAEAFFRTLDGIVDRIFLLEDPGKRRG